MAGPACQTGHGECPEADSTPQLNVVSEEKPWAMIGGQWHALCVDGTDALYELRTRNGAAIRSPTLFTGQARAEFYERFRFRGPEAGLYGMTLQTSRENP
jgi:hypothetical protein